MNQSAIQAIQSLVDDLADRAKYGLHGEKPLAIYAMLCTMRSSEIQGKTGLNVLREYKAAIGGVYRCACAAFGRVKSSSNSWSVIAKGELQSAISSTPVADSAFAMIGSEELDALIAWFESRVGPRRELSGPSAFEQLLTSVGPQKASSWIIEDRAAPRLLESWSTFRLPFEPAGEQLAYRDALRAAIRRLNAPGQSVLRAEYRSRNDPATEFDLENVLFYNVGCGTFSHLTQTGVVFERSSRPIPKTPSGDSFQCYTAYEVLPELDGFRHWRRSTGEFIEVTGIPCNTIQAAGEVWATVQNALDDSALENAGHILEGCLGVEVNLQIPSIRSICAFLKPLLDGVLSAFQVSAFAEDELIQRIARQTRRAPDVIKRWLSRSDGGIICKASPVRLYRDGVRWNPEDHRCHAVVVRSELRQDVGDGRMQIKIYGIEPKQ